jgi:hypothetical protein
LLAEAVADSVAVPVLEIDAPVLRDAVELLVDVVVAVSEAVSDALAELEAVFVLLADAELLPVPVSDAVCICTKNDRSGKSNSRRLSAKSRHWKPSQCGARSRRPPTRQLTLEPLGVSEPEADAVAVPDVVTLRVAESLDDALELAVSDAVPV